MLDINRYFGEAPMRTVHQITLEEELVQAVDQAAGQLALTRSAFARDAAACRLGETGAGPGAAAPKAATSPAGREGRVRCLGR